jgi:hypothetical protein
MGLFNGRVGTALSGFGGLLIAVCATGCGGGGDSKPSGPDFSTLQKEYTHPSGTLAATDKDAIIAALDSQSASAGAGILSAPPGLSNAKGPGPHVLDTTPTCGTPTSSGETCTCPGGGSYAVSVGSSSSNGATGTVSYKMCNEGTAADAITLTGNVSFDESLSPMIFIYSGSIDETLSSPPTTLHVDLNYALIGDMLSYNVTVGDGNVLVQASADWDTTTKTGSFTVVTKDGTTMCTLTNGAGSCTGAGGTVTFS